MKKLLALCTFAILLGPLTSVDAANPTFCWDKTDQLIVKMKKVRLTNEQLIDVFAYQTEHRAVIKRAHSEDLGCRYHEDHQVDFQKSAFGVLTDEQFQKLNGRKRTEAEQLRYENYLLKKELEALKRELAELKG
jgi:hypothetical protein